MQGRLRLIVNFGRNENVDPNQDRVMGGITTAALGLCSALARRGHEVHFSRNGWSAMVSHTTPAQRIGHENMLPSRSSDCGCPGDVERKRQW